MTKTESAFKLVRKDVVALVISNLTVNQKFYFSCPSFDLQSNFETTYHGQSLCPSSCNVIVNNTKKTLTEFLQMWRKYPLGVDDHLIRFWLSEVKGHGHCDLIAQKHREFRESGNLFRFGLRIHNMDSKID